MSAPRWLFSRKLGLGSVFTLHPKRVILWRRFTVLHAHKGGGPVLKDDPKWRNVNGFAVTFQNSTLLVMFRRKDKWAR